MGSVLLGLVAPLLSGATLGRELLLWWKTRKDWA